MPVNNPAIPLFPWLYRLLRWSLGSIFVYSGATKLIDPTIFAVLIDAYGLLPEALLLPVAVIIAMVEVLAGAGLLVDIRGSLAVITGLLVLFIAILGFGIWMGLDIDCGCFGPGDPEATAFHGLSAALYRDIAMLVGVAFLYWWRNYRKVEPIRLSRLTANANQRRKHMSKWMLKLAVIGVLVAGLSCPAMAFLDDKFEKEVEKEAGAVKLVREVQRGGYDLVTTEELKGWIDGAKDMVIVDTMPYEASYKKGHVPGALQFLFPIPDMNEWDAGETDGKTQADFIKLLGPDKQKPIVVYCGFVKCTRSHNGAAWAVKLGYENVYRYSGGVFAWKGAEYPLEKAE